MFDSAKALLKGIKTTFLKFMDNEIVDIWEGNFNDLPSDSDKETYYLPMSLPGIKEFIDKINYTEYDDKSLEIVNKHWNRGINVKRDTLNDAKKTIGNNIYLWIQGMVGKYKSFPSKLIQLLLEANGNAFDGTAFFATSRPNIDTGSNTINNLYTGTATSATVYTLAQLTADFAGAKAALLGFKDRDNDPFNPNPSLQLWVPSHFEDIAQQLLSPRATEVYNGTARISNIYAGAAEVKVNQNQAATDGDLYLVNKSATYKPFIIQRRSGVKWFVKDDEENVDIKYFYKFRMGRGLFNPMSIVKINN